MASPGSSEAIIAEPASVPQAPAYGGGALSDVLPSVAAALGEEGFENTLRLPAANRAVVVLVDGLGARLLKRFASYAPTLRAAQQAPGSTQLDTVFPTTTAAALTSLATGVTPGEHGIVGYDSFDPQRRRVVNQLGGWPSDLDPASWQPLPTVLETLAPRRGVFTVSRPKFRSSALTRAGLRGGEFVEATGPGARVRATLETLRANKDALVYLYWDDLDKAGHAHGVDSDAWLHALEELDSSMRRLVAGVSPNTLVLLTADHGMVDVPPSGRLDYSAFPELLGGVEFTSGEPRGVQLHFEQGASDATREETARAWRERFGERVWVLTREEAIGAGLFGPTVREGVAGRIGDLLILTRDELALYDTRRASPNAMAMVGQHGSLTPVERKVPLLRLAG